MFFYTMGLLKKLGRQVNLRNHEVDDSVCVCAGLTGIGYEALVWCMCMPVCVYVFF